MTSSQTQKIPGPHTWGGWDFDFMLGSRTVTFVPSTVRKEVQALLTSARAKVRTRTATVMQTQGMSWRNSSPLHARLKGFAVG